MIDVGSHTQLVSDCGHKRHELCHLVLGKKIDLQVEIVALVGRGRHPVLTDQHESGEEDGFYRSHHRKDDKGWVELRKTRNKTEIADDPKPEYREVQIDEPHASGEACNPARKPFFESCECFLLGPAFLQRLDVAREHR